jgi:pimeloyl-ACP methyl ester carboxylesterase
MRAETNEVLKGIDWDTSAQQVRQAPPLTGLPLTVITRGRPTPVKAIWDVLQSELAAQRPGSRQIIAQNSGHGIQMDEPGVVIAAIQALIQDKQLPTS